MCSICLSLSSPPPPLFQEIVISFIKYSLQSGGLTASALVSLICLKRPLQMLYNWGGGGGGGEFSPLVFLTSKHEPKIQLLWLCKHWASWPRCMSRTNLLSMGTPFLVYVHCQVVVFIGTALFLTSSNSGSKTFLITTSIGIPFCQGITIGFGRITYTFVSHI